MFHSYRFFLTNTMIAIILLVVLSVCNGGITFHEKCPHDNVNFTTKVQNSSFVVLGKTHGKLLDPQSDTMFSVSFQVECIFKGPAIPKYINISNAGQVEGKTYCQDFPFGRQTIAFLERNLLDLNDTDAFIPTDFVEIPYVNNVTNELLVNTCGLYRLLPLESPASMTNVCPAVSTNPICIQNIESTMGSHIIPGGSQPQHDRIKSKSGSQIEVDLKSGVSSINLSSILLLFMAILCARWN